MNYNITIYNYAINGKQLYRQRGLIEYVVIHDTTQPGVNARQIVDNWNQDTHPRSQQFVVDTKGIIRTMNEESSQAYHVGRSSNVKVHNMCITNLTSIGIEMCVNAQSVVEEQTKINTKMLVVWLVNQYGIQPYNIVRHYDQTNEICPLSLYSKGTWQKWYELRSTFVNQQLADTQTATISENWQSLWPK